LTPSTRSSAASRHRTHPHHARDLSERPKRDDVGMPPFVAGAELPNGIAHATKEPLARPCRGAFSKRCCTNNTRVLLVILSQAFVFVGVFGKPVFPAPKRTQPRLGWNDLPLTGLRRDGSDRGARRTSNRGWTTSPADGQRHRPDPFILRCVGFVPRHDSDALVQSADQDPTRSSVTDTHHREGCNGASASPPGRPDR
jgi:hypothetical protein